MYSIANTHCDWSADEPTTRNSYFLPFNLNFIESLSSKCLRKAGFPHQRREIAVSDIVRVPAARN